MRHPTKRAAPRRAFTAAAAAAEPAWAGRSLFAVAVILACMILMRAWAGWGTGGLHWGWGAARWLEPGSSAAMLAFTALVLAASFTRVLPEALDVAGRALLAPGTRGRVVLGAVMAIAAALVFALPDRSGFVGDFLMRLGFARKAVGFAQAIPQATALDALFHGALPAWCTAHGLDALLFERFAGALRAALFVGAGVACVRALEARGAAALMVVALVVLQPGLALCTGYGKALADLVLVIAWLFAALVSVIRTGDARWRLVPLTLLGIALHRSGVLLVPAALAALVVRSAHDRDRAPWRRWAPLAALLAGLAVLAPALRASIGRADAEHLALLRGSSGAGGARLFTLTHLGACAELLGLVAPLVLLLPALLPAARRLPRREAWVLVLWLAPALALLAVVTPRQGLPRDWDVFAPAAMTVLVVVAALLAEALAHAPSRRGLALAVSLVAALPVADRLLLAHETARTLAMVHDVAADAATPVAERAQLHHYAGVVLARDGDWDAALPELRAAARLGPSEAHLRAWYQIAAGRGALADALEAARELAARDGSRDWAAIAARLQAIAEARAKDEALVRH